VLEPYKLTVRSVQSISKVRFGIKHLSRYSDSEQESEGVSEQESEDVSERESDGASEREMS
jgi:hypothetical protein